MLKFGLRSLLLTIITDVMPSMRFEAFLFLAACGSALAATGSRYANVPLAFERHGVASEAHYVAHGNSYTIDLYRAGARIVLPGAQKGVPRVLLQTVVATV